MRMGVEGALLLTGDDGSLNARQDVAAFVVCAHGGMRAHGRVTAQQMTSVRVQTCAGYGWFRCVTTCCLPNQTGY